MLSRRSRLTEAALGWLVWRLRLTLDWAGCLHFKHHIKQHIPVPANSGKQLSYRFSLPMRRLRVRQSLMSPIFLDYDL